MKTPKKWKMMLLTWVCIYPLINLIFLTLMPHIESWHPLVKTFVVTVILVPLMGLSLGLLQKKLYKWLIK